MRWVGDGLIESFEYTHIGGCRGCVMDGVDVERGESGGAAAAAAESPGGLCCINVGTIDGFGWVALR